MTTHQATIRWIGPGENFVRGVYSRAHTWEFDGGATLKASSSPSVVRLPYSDPEGVDPEEAFVASLSSCHMLTFLYEAARAGFEVLAYEDEAHGELTKNERGVPWVSRVRLRPKIEFASAHQPSPEELHRLHEKAHEGCFIANSVKTEVIVESPEREAFS